MILNIQFQICGLIMVIMIMFFYFSNKTLQMSSERVFRYLLVAVAICVTLDILSVIAINYMSVLPRLVVDTISKAYVVSVCFVAFFTHTYVFLSTNRKKLTLKQKIYSLAPACIGSLLIIILPIKYFTGNNQVYTYGIVINTTYMVVACYLLIGIIHTIKNHKKLKKHDLYAICYLYASWIVPAAIQFFKNEWLLVGFAMSAAMVFMYFCLENPSHNLDSRTGLFNQAAYCQYVEGLCYENQDFTLVMLSIDQMKFITETFGFHNVDVFVQDITQFLWDISSVKIFRNFDSKFTLVFSNEQEAAGFISDVKRRFSEPWQISNMQFNATVSLVEMQGSSCDLIPEKIIEFSRYFISTVSQNGSGCYIKVTRSRIQEREQNSLVEMAIRRAIEHKMVQIHYQPIYSIKEKRYVSAEALARITDENGKYISPDIFIRVAEQKGMILQLGKLIFEEVCKFISSSSLDEKGIEYIDINLSVVQCMQDRLADELLEIMDLYNIPPDFINLEITETAAVNSRTTLLENMNKLIEKGVTFSLDDYGTGYSNLAYIVDLPVKIIKIDKSIVQSYCEIEKVKIAMVSTIHMLKKLNLRIVIEGVETEEQMKEMYFLEVDYIQGYYFSKPLKDVEFIKTLAEQ